MEAIYWKKASLFKDSFWTKELFLNHVEAHILSYAASPGNVAPIYDVIVEDPVYYIVLTKRYDYSLEEFCGHVWRSIGGKGGLRTRLSLKKYLTKDNICRVRYLVDHLHSIAKALSDMQAVKVYHRFVIPRSIRVQVSNTNWNKPKLFLSDFSFAKHDPKSLRDRGFQYIEAYTYCPGYADKSAKEDTFVQEGWWEIQDSLNFVVTLLEMHDEARMSYITKPYKTFPFLETERMSIFPTFNAPKKNSLHSRKAAHILKRLSDSKKLLQFTPAVLYKDFYQADERHVKSLPLTEDDRFFIQKSTKFEWPTLDPMSDSKKALVFLAATIGLLEIIGNFRPFRRRRYSE